MRKLKGGYNVRLAGRPSMHMQVLPEPEALHLPLWSRRFRFSELCVDEGQHVLGGQVLARDRDNFSVPLLAPRAGTVRLDAPEGHVTLQDIDRKEELYHPDEDLPHVRKRMGSVGMARYKLVTLGAWQSLSDAHTGALPDPFGVPRAVIVSSVHLEPFVARGDVQIHKRLNTFIRGLEHLQSLLEYQPIYLVMPDIESDFAARLRDLLRGYAWVRPVLMPLRCGLDNLSVLARHLDLPEGEQPVWALGVEGLLAIDRALTLSRPCDARIVTVGGPAATSPQHCRAMPGYPLEAILDGHGAQGPVRVLNGGVLTGTLLPPEQKGLDAECVGLTLLSERIEREFLGFLRPGLDRASYSRCFLSVLRRPGRQRLSAALRGQRRACVACGFCEEVCPARIMPNLIHKSLYYGDVEEAEKLGLHLCVRCGLCSFVCPSKIELRDELTQAQTRLQEELQPEEVEA
ncbi:MAG: 4Fe-4S dicluster domain-containing protein [Planctomycetota bacterium]|jgi:Na+-transporting NADH:ubiquinone oxidoreductase subunit A